MGSKYHHLIGQGFMDEGMLDPYALLLMLGTGQKAFTFEAGNERGLAHEMLMGVSKGIRLHMRKYGPEQGKGAPG